MSEAQPVGRPGRYQRSTNGLVGALLVTVLAVTAYAVSRGLNRQELEVRPEPVEYLSVVEGLQEAGRQVVYPPTLPEGWIATSVDVRRGDRPAWAMGMLTDEGRFVGLRQVDEDTDDLLAEHVDERTTEAEALRVEGGVVPEWEGYADEGGDHAYVGEVTSEVGEETVLVYGSAPVADLEALIGLLATAPQDSSGPAAASSR